MNSVYLIESKRGDTS